MKQNLAEVSIRLGRSVGWLYTLKKQNNEVYKLMLSYDRDAYASINKFKEIVEDTRLELQDIIYGLEEIKGGIHKFSVWLYKQDILKHENSFSAMVIQNKFMELNTSWHRVYKSDKRLVEAYERYRGEK